MRLILPFAISMICACSVPELVPQDAGSDAMDAARDSSAPDVGVDARLRDVGLDVHLPDIGVRDSMVTDAMTQDARMLDAARVDAAALDASFDAALDAAADSAPDSGGIDLDGDRYSPPEDCDDRNPFVNPGAREDCNGMDDDCDGRVDEEAPCGGCVQQFIAGRSFQFCSFRPLSWEAAESECQRWGYELASIPNERTDLAIRNVLEDEVDNAFWIGLRQPEDAPEPMIGWDWSDGSSLSYTGWGLFQPDANPSSSEREDCAVTNHSSDRRWNDEDCGYRFSYICATPP